MSTPVTRRRSKLAPDPEVRRAILAAASKSVREQGVQGLSIGAVLERAQLSTRAFYRHFESKDQLVEAVAAWIDGRLDLAYNENIKSQPRALSLEAQSQIFASPRLVQSAYAAMLEPLTEQLTRGLDDGVFAGIDPTTAAQSVQGVVWALTERQWATGACEHADVRARALRFCLRGLGVAPERITQLVGGH
jgi:AcrR family transcriptional regulator